MCLICRNHICIWTDVFWKNLYHDGGWAHSWCHPSGCGRRFPNHQKCNKCLTFYLFNSYSTHSVFFRLMFLFCSKCPKKEFLLRVSYMEIYNETVTDLLVDSWKRKPLEIRETINVRGRVGTVDRNVPTVFNTLLNDRYTAVFYEE